MTLTRLTALTALVLPALAFAQPAILSNGSTNPYAPAISTGASSASGVPAAAGTFWSELQADVTGANAVGGLAAHPSGALGGFRLADNFTVTAAHAWRIDNVVVYAYQTGAATNPFASANLRIWSGRPGDVGSVIVFGDTTTNRLSQVSSTAIYRIFNSVAAPAPTAPDTSKLIWALTLNTGQLSLDPGTYWLDWQIVPASATGEAFCPTVTRAAQRTQAGVNARQLTPAGAWTDTLDTGKPAFAADVNVDLPFTLNGYVGAWPCTADFDGDGDFGTDFDIQAFFSCLGGDCCALCGTADFNGDGDAGTDADIESFFRVLGGGPC